MPTARRARLAVVGLGRIGRLHADNLANRVPGAELSAVADVDEPVARELAARHGVAYMTSFDELLDNLALDGVVIAAPSALHPALVKRAAAAGKHVFCEKPLGLECAACAEAVAAVDAAGVTLQVGFQRRFDPDWRALRRTLDGGSIGSLALFRCSHRNAEPPNDEAGLGDLIVDVAIHDLDAARWLGGEAAVLHAAALPEGVGATISLRFESGALGLIDVHRHARYGFECSAELVGSAGTARCGYPARRDTTELLARGSVSAPLALDHAERHAAAYIAELAHFAAVVSGAAEPLVDGADALAALRLANRAAQAL
ncbi:MAG: scyllo-inositol 2-dehydrogenase [Thermoleophilaceae bacterium]|nr:scyllo-inositol 2-dehydrogenase [Thermoleophilaceae bacterium]